MYQLERALVSKTWIHDIRFGYHKYSSKMIVCIGVRGCLGWSAGQQIRYAHYFEQQLRVIKQGCEPVGAEQDRAPAILLHRVRLHTVPHFNSDGGCDPFLTIEVKSEVDHRPYIVFRSPERARARPGVGTDSSGSPMATVDGSRRGSFERPAQRRGSFERPSYRRGSMEASGPLDTADVAAEAVHGAGTRVAGDVCFTLYADEGRSKVIPRVLGRRDCVARGRGDEGGRGERQEEVHTWSVMGEGVVEKTRNVILGVFHAACVGDSYDYIPSLFGAEPRKFLRDFHTPDTFRPDEVPDPAASFGSEACWGPSPSIGNE